MHDRQYTARVAAVADAAPGLLGTVVIDDGSGAGPGDGISYDDALAAGAPDRDFGARSSDDVYIIYTGGTTGLPKGVMWRHEDIWRTLGGGIDFITGEPAGRRVGAVPPRAGVGRAWSGCARPR